MRKQFVDKEAIADYERFSSINRMVNKFENQNVPSKIRKIDLLEEAGLPIPKTDYFPKNEIQNLKDKIEERLRNGEDSLVIRIACVPDVHSMPVFYIEKDTDINELIDQINNLLTNELTITHFILRESMPETKAKDKISGRIILEDKKVVPRENVIELYKGARSTAILNTVDIADPNYQRFEKKKGEPLKQITRLSDQSEITEKDMEEINDSLEKYKLKMKNVKEVIAKSGEKDIDDILVCLEFTYLDHEIKFTDID